MSSSRGKQRSYMEALRLYLRYGDKSVLTKLGMVAAGLTPITALDDIILPVAGLVDEPLLAVGLGALLYFHRKVRKYQKLDMRPSHDEGNIERGRRP